MNQPPPPRRPFSFQGGPLNPGGQRGPLNPGGQRGPLQQGPLQPSLGSGVPLEAPPHVRVLYALIGQSKRRCDIHSDFHAEEMHKLGQGLAQLRHESLSVNSREYQAALEAIFEDARTTRDAAIANLEKEIAYETSLQEGYAYLIDLAARAEQRGTHRAGGGPSPLPPPRKWPSPLEGGRPLGPFGPLGPQRRETRPETPAQRGPLQPLPLEQRSIQEAARHSAHEAHEAANEHAAQDANGSPPLTAISPNDEEAASSENTDSAS